MCYLKSEKGKKPEETLNKSKKVTTNNIECFKVVEEYLSSTGNVRHRTLPLYCELNEDVVSGKLAQTPECEDLCFRERTNSEGIELYGGLIYSYKELQDACDFIEAYFVGYPETHPVIYRCIIPSGTVYYQTLKKDADDNIVECYASRQLMYKEPLIQHVAHTTLPYKKLTKQEKKPKKYGIVYDETDFNGDTDFEENI